MKLDFSRNTEVKFISAIIASGLLSNPNTRTELGNETIAHVAVNVAKCIEKEVNERFT